MTRALLFLGVVTIPFSAFAGLGFLGELAPELSTYFFMPAVASFALSYMGHALSGHGPRSRPRAGPLTAIALAAICIILVSFMANAASITSLVAHGRFALAKFATSFAVILYCFALSYVVFFESGKHWHRFVFKPIAISAVLCIGFSILEILSRKMSVANGLYGALDELVHAGWNPAVYGAGWDDRIRSVAFEAPAFGNYVGFVWPWLIAGWANNTGRSRRFYFIIWLLLTALELYSWSRTAIVMMGGSTLVFILLRYGYMPPLPRSSTHLTRRFLSVVVFGGAMIGGVIAVTEFNAYEAVVIAGSSVSDLTRLAYTEASFNMMTDHPLFGLGLGQFAFWLLEYVPSWAYLSYEVANWSSSYPPVHFWPASYTVYGRLAGELGVVGLLFWILLWLGLARKMLTASLDYQRLTGSLPAVSYALVVSCFCVLWSGLTTDTFRSPMIWITLGLSCRYLVEIRTVMRRRSDVVSRAQNFHWTLTKPIQQVDAIPRHSAH
jgi:hypothetical protein